MKYKPPGPKAMRRVGQRFGRWTVEAVLGYSKHRPFDLYARAVCDCGHRRTVPMGNLYRGLSTQCWRCGSAAAGRTRRAATDAALMAKGTPSVGRARDGHRLFPCGDCGAAIYGRSRCRACENKARWGRPKKYPECLVTVGARFGVSREYVRQLTGAHGWPGMLAYLEARKARLEPIGAVA